MTQLITTPQRTVIAEYTEYLPAQAAVDLLADKDFEVGTVRIGGHDLKSVEIIGGKMTYGCAALYGFGSGAWFGLMIGLLFGLFSPGIVWVNVVLGSVLVGGLFGLIFGLIGHAIGGKARGFSSANTMKASSYTVEVNADRADEALRILAAGR